MATVTYYEPSDWFATINGAESSGYAETTGVSWSEGDIIVAIPGSEDAIDRKSVV